MQPVSARPPCGGGRQRRRRTRRHPHGAAIASSAATTGTRVRGRRVPGACGSRASGAARGPSCASMRSCASAPARPTLLGGTLRRWRRRRWSRARPPCWPASTRSAASWRRFGPPWTGRASLPREGRPPVARTEPPPPPPPAFQPAVARAVAALRAGTLTKANSPCAREPLPANGRLGFSRFRWML